LTAAHIVVEQASNGTSRPRRHVAPLLAVTGVCGGAGASTLSYLIARHAVAREQGHVLVCDTGGPTGGLALRAGVESVRSLAEASEHVARELPLAGGLYAVDPEGSTRESELRVIATGPRLAGPGDPRGLRALLAMARADGAHALTVVDCGTLQRAADRFALRRASHVAWVLPATEDGIGHAERLLACIRPTDRAELVVARRIPRATRGRLRRLRALAETRNAPLVLMPDACDIDRAQLGLQAILGVLER
jgi:hypothetical protein